VCVGNYSGRKAGEFKKFRLKPLHAVQVAALLTAECFANLDCRIVDARLASKDSSIVLDTVRASVQKALNLRCFCHFSDINLASSRQSARGHPMENQIFQTEFLSIHLF